MRFPSKAVVEVLRRQYPVGTRVELVRMDDPQAPPIGTKGTVKGVDDIGSIMVAWAVCWFEPARKSCWAGCILPSEEICPVSIPR